MHKTKEDRQREAAERQGRRNARTAREQLKQLKSRPGRSFKEAIRLIKESEQSA